MKVIELLWAAPIAVVGYIGWLIYQDHAATVAGNAAVAAETAGAAPDPSQLAVDYTGSGIAPAGMFVVSPVTGATDLLSNLPVNPYTGGVDAQSLTPQILDPYTQSPGTVSELPTS